MHLDLFTVFIPFAGTVWLLTAEGRGDLRGVLAEPSQSRRASIGPAALIGL
jgi:hypothetical protein